MIWTWSYVHKSSYTESAKMQCELCRLYTVASAWIMCQYEAPQPAIGCITGLIKGQNLPLSHPCYICRKA